MKNKLAGYRTLLQINGIIALLFGLFALFVPQNTAKTIVIKKFEDEITRMY
jgi:uncharacterized membrane protein HdeD (DUF308 family)